MLVTAAAAGDFTPALREAWLAEAGESLAGVASPGLVTWLDRHPAVRTGLLTGSDPVDPEQVVRLDRLRQAMGPERADRYASLLLAVSSGPDPLPTVAAPPDSRVAAVADHLKRSGMSLLEARQAGDRLFDQAKVAAPGKKEAAAFWEQLAHATGTYPRRESMTLEESLALLIGRYETALGPFEKGPSWPLYPLDAAPWPLLAPLRQTLPRSESDFLWDRFRGQPAYPDGTRWKTYARYSWDYDRDPAVRWKTSPFHPSSIPRIAEDGGVCGRLSTLGQFSCVSLGKPAVGMYQPGHRAMLSYNGGKDGWFAKLEQSITGPERSTAQWFLPAPAGLRVSGNAAQGIKTGVEWHVALNLAMNVGLDAWTDARIAMFSARRLHARDPRAAIRLATEATAINPYLLDAWYQLAEWSRGDLRATNALLARLDRLMIDPSAGEVGADAELSASTDFNQLKPAKKGSPMAQGWTLVARVVAPVIATAAYQPALADKARHREAHQLLVEELDRREKLKMPYGAGLNELALRFEVALEGPRPAQQRMEAELKKLLAMSPKVRGKAAPAWLGQVDAVGSGLPGPTERSSWFARLQRELPGELAVSKAKDGKVAVDPLYKGLHELQRRELRAKGKTGKKELQKLERDWQRATAG